MHRGEPGLEHIGGGASILVTSPAEDKSLHLSSEDVTQNPDAHPQLVSSEHSADTSKIKEQSVDCIPLKTSAPENRVENLEVLPDDLNNNGHPSLNEISQKCKETSPYHMSEALQNGVGKNGEVVSNGHASKETKPTPETDMNSSYTKYSGLHREIVIGLPSHGQFGTLHTRMSAKNLKSLGRGGKINALLSKENNAGRSSVSQGRAPKSGSQGKSKETALSAIDGQRMRKRGRKKGAGREDDEYTRIRRKLRYLLNRINYEQSLINAYSSEGWKGLSLEKLRPEKELERATKEILRRKLRIRELFHHLGSLSAEGKIPETLFDSEGEIDSEDIFCAKCGSKDLSLDNDIILCDGVCDRGFHQYCLEPPLRREDIPPGDEGWLCPGCDCKVDCVDLLNELLGTKLSINDAWEKIFPEVAAAAAGGDQNLNLGLPSDDSDDDDYDPDGLDDNENDDDDDHSDDNKQAQSDESSGESDFTSASDEMVGAAEGGQDLNLPSDDSEDDDYDPDAPTRDDEDEKEERSTSDFTSDSEDLGTLLKDNEPYQEDEVTVPGESSREKAQLHGSNERSESDAGNDGFEDVPRRRSVERLNYKKLYDEAYGHVPSSSSDDEDWDKIARAREDDSESGDETANRNEGDTGPWKKSSHAGVLNPTMNPKRKTKRADKNETLIAEQEGADENGSLGKGIGSSSHRKLRTQRLSKAFQENRYPDAATKEKLARELEMTVKQVNNWFRNRRSSSNTTLVKIVSKEDVEKLTPSKEGPGETSLTGCSQHTTESEPVEDSNEAPGSRKRRRR